MTDPTGESSGMTTRELILLAIAARLQKCPALQDVPVHVTRPMTLRDRVTLATVEIVAGTGPAPAIDVQAIEATDA